MKKVIGKITPVMTTIFGYGIMVSLLVGGLSFFGYLAAIIIGGETAGTICTFIYKTVYPIIVLLVSCTILLGLIKMYLCGESAFSAKREDREKNIKQRVGQ